MNVFHLSLGASGIWLILLGIEIDILWGHPREERYGRYIRIKLPYLRMFFGTKGLTVQRALWRCHPPIYTTLWKRGDSYR